MERPPHYDYRDVLWAPAKALTAKRILTMTVFIGVAFVLFDAFVYLALAFEGENLKFVWGAYNIFPFVNFHLESLAASAVYAIGALAALLALMLGFLAVAEMDMEQIRGNRFLTFQEATQFALSRLGQMLVSEITIVAFLVFVAVVFALMGLISRIPFVGEWLYALFFAVPGFIVAILSVFTIAVLSVSVLLLPAVAAAERKGEAFGAILETFSTVIRQPWRWLGYTAYSLVAAKVCGFIYAYFCYRAVQLPGRGLSSFRTVASSGQLATGAGYVQYLPGNRFRIHYRSLVVWGECRAGRLCYVVYDPADIHVDLWLHRFGAGHGAIARLYGHSFCQG